MMGIGAFTPLDGFMGKADWQGCCDNYTLPSKKNLFWPIPITLSTEEGLPRRLRSEKKSRSGTWRPESLVGTMKVTEKYTIDKAHECKTGVPHRMTRHTRACRR